MEGWHLHSKENNISALRIIYEVALSNT